MYEMPNWVAIMLFIIYLIFLISHIIEAVIIFRRSGEILLPLGLILVGFMPVFNMLVPVSMRD